MTETDKLLHDSTELAAWIKTKAQALGLSHCAITDTQLDHHETHLLNWLNEKKRFTTFSHLLILWMEQLE